MKRGLLRGILHDLAVTVLAGIAAAVGLSVILLLVGLLINSFAFRPALVLVRGGLLVFGALELFVSSGLMIRNREIEKIRDSNQWKRLFDVFGLVPVLLVTSVIILTAASFLDYYLYF